MSDHPLLEIQHLDTTAEQLRHRHANLEERTQRDDAVRRRSAVEEQIAALAASRLEVVTRQKRLEEEAQGFSDRADQDETRLYGGDVGLKGLEALQDEIKGLRSRQGDLEDQALDAMEESESLSTELSDLEGEQQTIEDRLAELEAALAAAEGAIVDEQASVVARRAELAASVAPEELATYERLHSGLGAATVVRFEGANCVGCPSTMPAVEADRIKHTEPGSTQTCDECGRLVLR